MRLPFPWAGLWIFCPGAPHCARECKRHGVEGRIIFVQSNLLDSFPEKACFDFILCNPPYVALDECDTLPTEVRDYEPHEALFGGTSGMDVYVRLIPEVLSRLVPGGWLLLELGAGQAQQVSKLARARPLPADDTE